MPKRTIVLDFETATDDDWQRAAEALAAVEAGMPVWEALGEPEPAVKPTKVDDLAPGSILADYLARILNHGDQA